MRTTFICTILNEENLILDFLRSLDNQSCIPDEAIFVDGGSTDSTYFIIKNYKFKYLNRNKVKVLKKEGNRSIGRNYAVKNSSGNIIACSDSGCILEKKWVENITKPFLNKKVDVVAGYYKAAAKNVFERSLSAYVLVMPDKINPSTFLPSSRSMAFRKEIWNKAGGFPEKFSNNEDYVFSNSLKSIKAKIIFKKDAIVYWVPRKNIFQAFYMFYRFAKGDAESSMWRIKVFYIFIRYVMGIILFLLFIINRSSEIIFIILLSLIAYIYWSIKKNYKYVMKFSSFYIFPLLQIASDFAVIFGTIIGLVNLFKYKLVKTS